MRMKLLAAGCVASSLLITAPRAAPASDVGRRFPAERRAIVDAETRVTITALTTSPADDSKIYQTHPQWTADGAHIVFLSDRAGGRKQAFALAEATGEIVQLTDEPGGAGSIPALSRRSNRLYFLPGDRLVELALDPLLSGVRDPGQSRRAILTLPEGMTSSGGLSLDADERTAYFGVKLPGAAGWGLRAVNLGTGAMTRVIDLPFRVGHVQANPAVPGEILYCHETGGDAPQRMWLVRADGSENRPLYRENSEEWVTHEVWADRDHVIFNLAGGQPGLRAKPTGLVLIDVRSQEVQPLGQVGGKGFWHGAITPDQKWAVGDTSTGEVYRVDVATGARTLLSRGHRPRGSRAHPHQSISPDGRRVLINSGLLGNSDLMTIPLHPEPGRP